MRFAVLLALCISAQAAKLPTIVRIDGQPWAIKLVERINKDRNITGSTECAQRTILIDKSLDAWSRADIITHEVQHAFTCDFGEVHNEKLNNNDSDKEFDGHKGIYFSAPKWHRFIHDNPELMRYIIDSEETPIELPLQMPQRELPPR